MNILGERNDTSLKSLLLSNRPYATGDVFFEPTLSHLHDPYLFPDMEASVNRILEARKKKERIVIF